jgi:lipopolysaccharide export system permease protein
VIPRLLDRYVLSHWLRLFLLTALGFPIITILINLTDQLSQLLDRGLTARQILLSYVFLIPENLFLVIPAAVLFATVFTVGSLSRHSELTAAKASGRSFHRLVLPVLLGAVGAAALGVGVGELAPVATARSLELRGMKQATTTTSRYNFVYRGDAGWVYTIRSLDVSRRVLGPVLLERQGAGPAYPTLVVTADSGRWDEAHRRWTLYSGASRVIATPAHQAAFRAATIRLRAFTEPPAALLAEPKSPDEMRYAELRRYIDALKRSGNDASKLEVDLALKLAVPATCIVIALFGAPLAITSHRSGPAVGIAISLATTVAFLMLAQIARAVGSGGLVDPVAAAWLPNAAFLLAALWLLARART